MNTEYPEASGGNIHILIVDDHAVVRDGIRVNLERAIPEATVSEVGAVAEAVEILEKEVIDIVILDLRLDDGSGLEVAAAIRDRGIQSRCVVFTSVGSPAAVVEAFDTGVVSSFLEKGVDVEPLVAAIRSAYAGGGREEAVSAVKAAAQAIKDSGGFDFSTLTKRERSIAELVAEGLSDADIASALYIALPTVRNNLTAIYKKAGVSSRTRLAGLVWDYNARSTGGY